ncbi:MAG: Anaphase-promoting complex subunit 23 [Geoglossum umbratile]|nr:MAG: Anaphase-promoting complex subunit 23 [Geoglossum umbratile]
MAGLSPRETGLLCATLQDAVVKCSERCLYQSAKWAAELLMSLSSTADLTPASDTEDDSQMSDAVGPPEFLSSGPVPVVVTSNASPGEAALEAREASGYLLAKSYFDCREYDRCAAVFIPETPATKTQPPLSQKGKSKASTPASAYNPATSSPLYPQLSQKSLFLALYAKYMAGEKRRDEESEMILGPADGGSTTNAQIGAITKGLEGWFAELNREGGAARESQGWLEYLYGIVLCKAKNEEEAKKWLVRSVNLYPYNWGAWQELGLMLETVEDLNNITQLLPRNIMTLMFQLYTSQELYQSTYSVHNQLTELEGVFPNSQWLKTQRALLYYHSRDFDEAESIFSALMQKDPYRTDALDHYSNILYVMANRPKLAFLAQLATASDKFRPETCCVVGNYYSLKSDHEKAVMYFRRALTLDRGFLTAWTLMGHEYVEMKNTHAAIEAYRRAVDINRKDYRAWYGLGQTYEVLEMHYYALFYYQRAASLKPFDSKMWQAVGACLDKMNRPREAIKAHKRALIAGYDRSRSGSFGGADAREEAQGVSDPETLYQIALMYEKLGEYTEAAAYMSMTLACEEGPDSDADGRSPSHGVGVTTTTSRARMWLARWEFGRENLGRAMELATELCQDGVEVEEAKALVRDLRSRMEGERS